MTDDKLTAPAVAALLGIAIDTWWGYVTRAERERSAGRDRPSLAPRPDGREPLSNRAYWHRSTILAWHRNRPGQGARTDLKGQ